MIRVLGDSLECMLPTDRKGTEKLNVLCPIF